MRCAKEVVVISEASGEGCSAVVKDPNTGSVLYTFKQAGAVSYRTLKVVSDSYIIAADATKPRLHMWALNSALPVPNLRMATPGKVSGLTCTPNGLHIAAAVQQKIYVWLACTGKLVAILSRHYQTINSLTFNKDGASLASGGDDGLIFVWSLCEVANNKDAKPTHSFSDHTLPVTDLYYGHLGSLGRLCSTSLDCTAKIYDPCSGLLLVSLVFEYPLTTICMDLLENSMFVGSSTGEIAKCNLRESLRGIENHNTEKSKFKGHESSITTLSVSTDCQTMLSGSNDGMVQMWDIPSCQVIRTFRHKSPITAAFFTKAYGNFSANIFKPSVIVKALQRSFEEGAESEVPVEMTTRQKMLDILNFNVYVPRLHEPMDKAYEGEKVLGMQQEIERLKRINASLYKYVVKNVSNNKK